MPRDKANNGSMRVPLVSENGPNVGRPRAEWEVTCCRRVTLLWRLCACLAVNWQCLLTLVAYDVG